KRPHEEVQRQKRFSPELNPYLRDPAGQAQPLIGREAELNRLIELLCRLEPKNPVLVGEPGVGKATIVASLARRIAEGDVPEALARKNLLSLDLPPLRALDKDGSWSERVDSAVVSAAREGIILVAHRMHDRPGDTPAKAVFVTDALQRPIA